MAKRRNPRAEEAPLQWKTHVGFKQMATKEEKERIKGSHNGVRNGLHVSRKGAPKSLDTILT